MKKTVYSLILIFVMMLFVSCEKNEPRGTISTVEINAYPIDHKVTFSVTAYAASKITVDWGDGMIETFDVIKNFAHEYANSGIQTILITAETLTSFATSDGNLEELKLMNCLDLKYLFCGRLKLKEIKLAEAQNLEELDCSQNQLTALDLSKNTSLTKLECWQNQLINLDLSKNTVLTNLDCRDNQLTNLDVSNNTALVRLDCGWNQLTSLDVSNCVALYALNCRNNQLTSLGLSGSINLMNIQCRSNQLTADTLNTLFESLPTLTYGGSIVISENPGTLEANKLIAKQKGWSVRID